MNPTPPFPTEALVPLPTIARIIHESRPAHNPDGADDCEMTYFARGCESARERIANAIADTLDMRPSERAAFIAAAGVANLP